MPREKKAEKRIDERKHPPPVDRAPGTDAPGFAGEGQRSELGDGKPIDPEWRRRFAEHNRKVTP